MSSYQAAQRYGETFYRSMQEKKWLDAAVRDATILVTLDQQAEQFKTFINSEIIPQAQKLAMLDKLFAKTLHPETYKFLRFMVHKQRSMLIGQMAAAFLTRYREHANIVQATLITAFPLSTAFITELSAFFEQKLGKKLFITTQVKASLLGGATLRIADRLYDFSLSGKLARLQELLL